MNQTKKYKVTGSVVVRFTTVIEATKKIEAFRQADHQIRSALPSQMAKIAVKKGYKEVTYSVRAVI